MFPECETEGRAPHTAGMSNKLVRQILVGLFAVSFSSVAFARNPPSLVKRQQASAHATQSGGGYRDINWRFGAVPARSPEVMRADGGYRDINYRFGAAHLTPTQTASRSITPTHWR
jgi:hypothetical protein